MTHANVRIIMLAGSLLLDSYGISHAETDYRDVLRDTDGHIVHLSNGTCVRTKWVTDRDLCAPPQRMAQNSIQQPVQNKPTTHRVDALTQDDRTVYFKFNRTVLSSAEQHHLDTLARILKSNESIKETKIVGYADRIGSASYNQKLSQKRAETVRDYLIAKGYTNANVTEIRWVGENEPSTHCPVMKNRSCLIACLHNDRRVEVEVEYVDQEQIPDAR